MENATHKLLESAVHRTLHANSFSRSSSQASSVLTDLLSRYMTLLTSTCAKYAQHAGRTSLAPADALNSLSELGVNLEELDEYCLLEGKELGRYAMQSARRAEELNELKAQLVEGLSQDRDDLIPLFYARCASPEFDEDAEDDEREHSDLEEGEVWKGQHGEADDMAMNISPQPQRVKTSRSRSPQRQATPPLPLSPISNPSSPSRKRARHSNWRPPSHVPDFLPPFPATSTAEALPPSEPHTPHPAHTEPPPSQIDSIKIEKPPLTLVSSQALASSSSSTSADYLNQVPYSQSTISGVPEWHLPSSFPVASNSLTRAASRLPTPQTEPSLFAAYHHILTHPPAPNGAVANVSRHKVAMALLSQTQNTSRWDPPDTLYSSIAPCPPRVAVIGPTYPVAIDEVGKSGKGGKERGEKDKDGKDKDGKDKGGEKEFKFPPTMPRPVSSLERLTPLISQQSSRIPDLARHVLPPTILTRTSRLTHPPVLYRGTKALIYGPGIPAPWNANALPSTSLNNADGGTSSTPITLKGKESAGMNGFTKGRSNSNAKGKGKQTGERDDDKDYDDSAPPPSAGSSKKESGGGGGGGGSGGGAAAAAATKPVIPDAKLYATWDYEPKDYRVPIPGARSGRLRMGSVQFGSGGGGAGGGSGAGGSGLVSATAGGSGSSGVISLGGRMRSSSRLG